MDYGHNEYLLGFAIAISAISAVATLLCFVAVLLFVRRKRIKKTEEKFKDLDKNPDYGTYAYDGVYTMEGWDGEYTMERRDGEYPMEEWDGEYTVEG